MLCLGAHSDDIEIGCGGTILKLISTFSDLSFYWLVFSANELRAAEARESAEAFLEGVEQKQIRIESFQDGYFPFTGAEIKNVFEDLKREFKPDLIFTHYRDDRHQDHRVISDLTWNTFRSHLILEYEIPKYDGDLGNPNLFVVLDEDMSDKKINILMRSFRSQGQKRWFEGDTFRSMLRIRGMECDAATRQAEAFYSRKSTLSC